MTVAISKLSNGMRVVTEQMQHLDSVSLGIWVGAGARSENSEQHGMSHLLEHMAFKGTPTRTARQIVEQIEAVGGDINAATSLENTNYHVRILKDDTELAINILSDIVQNPLFDDNELAREKDVILQEIAAADDSPDDLVYDLVQAVAYPDQPLGRTILGSKQSVMAATATDLRNFMQQHYTADRMVLSAAGAVGHQQIVALAEKCFANLRPKSSARNTTAYYQGGETCSDKSFEQSHVILAFEGTPYSDEDFYTSQILSGLLGGGMSSRLFQELRENRGLCYTIYSFSWALSDTGMFGVHAASGAEQMPELISVTLQELSKLSTTPPTEQEVARAKAQLKAGLLMSMESSSARAEQLARQLLAFGRTKTKKELLDRLESVSPADVSRLASRLFGGTRPSYATVGPMKKPLVLHEIADHKFV